MRFAAGGARWAKATAVTVFGKRYCDATVDGRRMNPNFLTVQNSQIGAGTVLVVDDEPEIVALISHHLTQAGYAVSAAYDGAEAIERLRAARPRLVVLDVMLPGITGFDVLAAIRAQPALEDLPVLMLTALRDDEDRIKGLSLGVDDYVTKPFNPEELVLRVNAILRRAGAEAQAKELTAGRISINLLSQRARIDGRIIDLTPTEYRLLVLLVQQQGRAIERAQLLSDVWAAVPDMQTRTVDVHVQRLRSKLGAIGESVETIRGVGYRLRIESPPR
jgi:two-component system, OmpR family, phosphate regulon response regulator PhoB